MSVVFHEGYRGYKLRWRPLAGWIPKWRRRSRRLRLDPRDVSSELLHDIGLTDVRPIRPKGISD